MFTDLPEAELRSYRSALAVPDDFDDFWAATLGSARRHPLDVRLERVETGLTTVDTWDVTYPGFDGQPVRGWLRAPAGARDPLPGIVEYIGYGGGRGHALDDLLWASAGYAHLVMDTRGQGSANKEGVTPDAAGSDAAYPGSMTRGILSPETYYYRRVFTDAVRAVDAIRSLDLVDAGRVAAIGGSQGGGITLAVAGLVPDLAGAVAFVPFLCDFPRGVVINDVGPFVEIARYLRVHREQVEEVMTTLSYMDGVAFARRASAPLLATVGLMDTIVPPSTSFAAFNDYAGDDKEIVVYPFNDHEGGGTDGLARALAFFRRTLGPAPTR